MSALERSGASAAAGLPFGPDRGLAVPIAERSAPVRHGAPVVTVIGQWGSARHPAERERLMLLAADEPTTLDADREAA